ncbi:MAG: hypothetical protein HZA08_07785 [Nitrospirae bacterium]|nr:hypothetical protein [Nitrospirota bacterium]
MVIINPDHIDEVLQGFRGQRFTTAEFKSSFQSEYPDDWDMLVLNYGEGGKDCGRNYSANVYLGQRLKDRVRRGVIRLVEFVPAPTNWGNDDIASWEYL